MDRTSPQNSPIKIATSSNLEKTLQQVVADAVQILGYVGAMITTCEQGDTLALRAFHIAPSLADGEQIHTWARAVFDYVESPYSFSDSKMARLLIYHEAHQDNLNVRSFRTGQPVRSDDLFDLFTPIVPSAYQPVVREIQQSMGICQVIAVPFFLETSTEKGQIEQEIAGNLLVAKQGEIDYEEALALSAWGQRVAAAIENEQRRLQIEITQRAVLQMLSDLQGTEQMLYQIARGIVSDLGYAGALVTTFEPDYSLLARVFYLAPELATTDQLHEWKAEVSGLLNSSANLDEREIARVLVGNDAHGENLGVRAYQTGEPVVSSDLYDLLTPLIPPLAQPLIRNIQRALGIQGIIAVPLFRKALPGDRLKSEFLGELVVATRSRKFNSGEINLLKALGQQAAVGIQYLRLCRQIEQARKISQTLGRMAFSATASAHALRNHVGAFRMYLHLLQVAPQERLAQVLQSNDPVISRLDQALEILDNLHRPWHETPDARTQVNASLTKALGKVVLDRTKLEMENGILIHESLAESLPAVNTSPHKLTEAFQVVIQHAVKAIRKTERGGELRIESRPGRGGGIEVIIADNGVGLHPEELDSIYELRLSNGGEEMDFGLFWTKEYIEGIGGEIHIDSTWTEGCTFTIRLPAVAHGAES